MIQERNGIRNAKCITWKEHIGNHNNVNSQYSWYKYPRKIRSGCVSQISLGYSAATRQVSKGLQAAFSSLATLQHSCGSAMTIPHVSSIIGSRLKCSPLMRPVHFLGREKVIHPHHAMAPKLLIRSGIHHFHSHSIDQANHTAKLNVNFIIHPYVS